MLLRNLSTIQTRNARGTPHCALILTALPLEAKAVLAHLDDQFSVRGDKGNFYECGTFLTANGDWSVVTAVTTAGNHPAGSLAHVALTEIKDVDLVLFVGIGGSLKDDVSLGAVVASSQVYFVHHGKAGTEFSARPRTMTPEFGLVQLAMKVAFDGTWSTRIRAPLGSTLPDAATYPGASPPSAIVAPVACSEQVLGSRKSPLYKRIKRTYSDAACVDMESYGALYATTYVQGVPGMAFRGISDMGDEDKTPEADKINQPVAAAHAAAFAFEFLSSLSIINGHTGSRVARPDEPSEAGGRGNSALPPSGATAAARTQYVISLDGDANIVDDDQLRSIRDALRDVTGDQSIIIVSVESGSIMLTVEGDREGVSRLQNSEAQAELAAKVGLRVLSIEPAPGSAIGELLDAFKAASTELGHWSRTLPSGEWLQRPELSTLYDRAMRENGATVLLGGPGAGKSAILSALTNQLQHSGRAAVVALKADLLPTHVKSETDLQHELGLPVDLRFALEQVSAWMRTVLIIDQLDAVAGYTDVKTGRLNLLLNIIRNLNWSKNVHVVLSCRNFEFEHDSRLRSVNAESVALQLPPWPSISEVLEKHGFATQNWPDKAKELLRSPQALRIFLEISETTGVTEPFTSYQAMLDTLWRDRILALPNGAALSSLAGAMANAMAEEESLWLPRARFEGDEFALQQLQAVGVLATANGGLAVGFSHQTIYEHALARSFAKQAGALSTYVLARQASLFIRPKLWAALNYLRAVSEQAYKHELVPLWTTPSLRRHVRQLLIEFMGNQPAPSHSEENLLRDAFAEPSQVKAAFKAIIGSPGWFERLRGDVIPTAMRDAALAPSLIPVLSAGWRFAPTKIADLITHHWWGDRSNDWMSWLVLAECPSWSPELTDMAAQLLRRSVIAGFHVNRVVSSVGVEQPQLAAQLIRGWLDFQLAQATSAYIASLASRPPKPEKEDELLSWIIEFSPTKSYEKILDDAAELDSVPELAQFSPEVFVDTLWDWYLQLSQRWHDAQSSESGERSDATYVDLRGLELPEDGEKRVQRHRDDVLFEALLTALRAMATHDSTKFSSWAAQNKDVPYLWVQRAIAMGYLASPETYADQAADFLLADKRRLMLGDHYNRFSTTAKLLAAVTPNLPREKVAALEEAIVTFKPHKVDDPGVPAKDRQRLRKYNRSDRLRLLRAFPADYLSRYSRRLIAQEERALNNPPDWDVRIGEARYVGSPFAAGAMARARDSEIMKALDELHDGTGWRHPREFMKGGNIQLAREFAAFSRSNAARSIKLIAEMTPGMHERAAAYAIEALAASDVDAISVLDLISSLHKRGFGSDEFRHTISFALQKLVERGAVIPSSTTDMLEEWLEDSRYHTASEARAEENNESEQDHPSSVLWGSSGFVTLPGGSFPVLDTLTRVLLTRPDALEHWMSVISEHLRRVPSAPLWRAMLPRLRALKKADRNAALAFLSQLFASIPSLRTSLEGILFVAQARWWLPESFCHDALVELASSQSPRARQAYGELSALFSVAGPKYPWADEAVLAGSASAADQRVRLGIAYAAANLWADREYRDASVDLMARLLPAATRDVASAIVDAFRVTDELHPDAPTIRFLELLRDFPEVASLGESFLVERLATMLPHEPELIGSLALLIAQKKASDISDIRTGGALTGQALVDLALTLHRFEGKAREYGLKLFELLLELDAFSARDALEQIDGRLRAGSVDIQPRRRLRPRRRRR